MDWMLTHQLSSKNFTVNERMAMINDFKEEVRLENEKKKKESDKQFHGNQYNKVNFTPNGVNSKIYEKRTTHSDTWTDSQTAKKAGAGIGTVSRYNKIMNSNEEDFKKYHMK